MPQYEHTFIRAIFGGYMDIPVRDKAHAVEIKEAIEAAIKEAIQRVLAEGSCGDGVAGALGDLIDIPDPDEDDGGYVFNAVNDYTLNSINSVSCHAGAPGDVWTKMLHIEAEDGDDDAGA